MQMFGGGAGGMGGGMGGMGGPGGPGGAPPGQEDEFAEAQKQFEAE